MIVWFRSSSGCDLAGDEAIILAEIWGRLCAYILHTHHPQQKILIEPETLIKAHSSLMDFCLSCMAFIQIWYHYVEAFLVVIWLVVKPFWLRFKAIKARDWHKKNFVHDLEESWFPEITSSPHFKKQCEGCVNPVPRLKTRKNTLFACILAVEEAVIVPVGNCDLSISYWDSIWHHMTSLNDAMTSWYLK